MKRTYLKCVIILFISLLKEVNLNQLKWRHCKCGVPKNDLKIFGGTEVKENFYPWAAALIYYPSKEYFCGATIISSRFLISAAHCFKNVKLNDFVVKVGIHNLSLIGGLTIWPKRLKIYEDFIQIDETPYFDIALIELEKDLPLTNKIRPICLHSLLFNLKINSLKKKIYSKNVNFDSNAANNKNNKKEWLFFKNFVFLFTFFKYKLQKFFSMLKNPPNKSIAELEDTIYFNENSYKKTIILEHENKLLVQLINETVNDYIESIQTKSLDKIKSNLIVIGWGSIYNGNALPNVLLEASIDEEPDESCLDLYGEKIFMVNKSICAYKKYKDSCNGDSGSALMNYDNGRYEIYGIVSFGISCGLEGIPSVYTKISAYLSWILLHSFYSSFCSN